MMSLNQPKALEAAAQALAKHFGQDYSEIRMTDHYLRKKRRPDRQIVAFVELADRLLRPHFDAITDLDDQVALLQLRIRSVQEEARNLADYMLALPGRLPAHLNKEHDAIQFRAWMKDQVKAAPFPHYTKPHQEPRQ